MTGVIPTATPGPLFVKDSPYPEDLARALAERGFYVFGRLNTQQAGKGGKVCRPRQRRYRGRASGTGSVFRPEHSDTARIPGRHSTIARPTAMDPPPLVT